MTECRLVSESHALVIHTRREVIISLSFLLLFFQECIFLFPSDMYARVPVFMPAYLFGMISTPTKRTQETACFVIVGWGTLCRASSRCNQDGYTPTNDSRANNPRGQFMVGREVMCNASTEYLLSMSVCLYVCTLKFMWCHISNSFGRRKKKKKKKKTK